LKYFALYAYEQDCGHQPALMYTENECTVKSLKLFEKEMFNLSTNVFDTYYKWYFDILVKYFKNLPLDLLSICRYSIFLDIYILQGSIAT